MPLSAFDFWSETCKWRTDKASKQGTGRLSLLLGSLNNRNSLSRLFIHFQIETAEQRFFFTGNGIYLCAAKNTTIHAAHNDVA